MEEAVSGSIGKINMLELGGSYRHMGREYGRLFRERLRGFYAAAVEGYLIRERRMPYLKLLALSWVFLRRYPPQFREMFEGMNETSRLGLNRLVMLDQLNTFELIRNQKIGRCSNISAWGDYTDSGDLVFGRNYDQPEGFKKFNEFIMLTVFNPDGGIPVANMGYVGQVGINSAMNKAGVLMVNNEAPILKGDRIDANAPNILLEEFSFLTRSSSLTDLDRCVSLARSNCPLIVSVADRSRAHTYEWTASGVKCRSGNGLMAATNHFADPSWKRPVPASDSFGRTGERLNNLMILGEKYKGALNARKMQELLDISIDEGGVTHNDKTVFQVVALPGDLTLHIKIPAFQDWIEVCLKGPFSRTALSGDFELSVEKV